MRTQICWKAKGDVGEVCKVYVSSQTIDYVRKNFKSLRDYLNTLIPEPLECWYEESE